MNNTNAEQNSKIKGDTKAQEQAGSSNQPDKITLPSRKWAPTPAECLPVRIAGMALYVNNLEAQREWYEKMLGMKVHRMYERDGAIF